MKVRDLSWEKGYTFSKKDNNNNYPWIIACADHDIITGSHVITDGTGKNLFMQTAVRIYLRIYQILPSKLTSIDDPSFKLNAAIGSNSNGKVYLNLVQKSKTESGRGI